MFYAKKLFNFKEFNEVMNTYNLEWMNFNMGAQLIEVEGL